MDRYPCRIARAPLKDYYTHQERDLRAFLARNAEAFIRETDARLRAAHGGPAHAPRVGGMEGLERWFETYTRERFPLATADAEAFRAFIVRTARPQIRAQPAAVHRTKDPRHISALPYPQVDTHGDRADIYGRLT